MNLFRRLSHIGVGSGSSIEKHRIVFSNRVYLITFCTAIIMIVASMSAGIGIEYQIANVLIITSILAGYCLNQGGYHYFSRGVVSISAALGFTLQQICCGGYFAQTMVYVTIAVIVFIFFEDRPKARKWIIFLTASMYIVSQIYLENFETVLPELDLAYDQILIFSVAMTFIIWVLRIDNEKKNEFVRQLESKNLNLESMSKEVERFSYIASHDLRSPLRTMNSFVGLLEKNIAQGDYQEMSQNIKYVKNGVSQMAETIDDILALSYVSSQPRVPLVQLDLGDAVRQALSNLAQVLEEKGVVVSVADDLPLYEGHRVEFVQLFQNLLENAVKYNTSATPEISIECRQKTDSISISVIDNGIGIETKYHNKIFEFFERLHNNDDFSGTGLGLALCKKIVEKYSGRITVKSEVGVGSIFYIELPRPKKFVPAGSMPEQLSELL